MYNCKFQCTYNSTENRLDFSTFQYIQIKLSLSSIHAFTETYAFRYTQRCLCRWEQEWLSVSLHALFFHFPQSPLVFFPFFRSLYFSLALHHLNAWNRVKVDWIFRKCDSFCLQNSREFGNWGIRVKFNVEFTRQAMDFSIESTGIRHISIFSDKTFSFICSCLLRTLRR